MLGGSILSPGTFVADDIVLDGYLRKQINGKLELWKEALEIYHIYQVEVK